MPKNKNKEEWRGGVFLVTAEDSLQADIFESKLRGEGIPCLRKYKGAGNFMEIAMGQSLAYPIDLYVPKETLEDAKNIIEAFPLLEEDSET